MQNKPHAKKRCGAKTRSGKPCKNGAMENGRCRMHGGKSTGAPPEKMKKNKNSEKHGLFAKHLPPETLELVEQFEQEEQITRLKRNIAIQEAAIIRSQSIMHVEAKDELVKELKKLESTDYGDKKEYEIQFAWDRQGNYLTSLSRAMTTLMNMYKTLAELTSDEQEDVQSTIGSFVEALEGTSEDVWNDEEEA